MEPLPVLRAHKVRNDRDRVRLIFQQAWKGVQNPQVRGQAIAKARRCASRDDECELGALFDDQQRRIKYMADVTDVDTYASPQRTIAWGAGDCDDHVSKLIAEGTTLGFRMGARVIPPTKDRDGHIMALAGLPKNEPKEAVVLDTTVPGAYPGWQPPARKMRGWQDYWMVIDEGGAHAELGDNGGTTGVSNWAIAGLVLLGAAAVGTVVLIVKRRAR